MNTSTPTIYARRSELAELRAISQTAGVTAPGAALFVAEVERLSVVADDARERFVRLDDRVVYRDLRTKREREVSVVRPGMADPEENRVSILSPLGAALIGLPEEAMFRWTGPDGRLRVIKVVSIADRDAPRSPEPWPDGPIAA